MQRRITLSVIASALLITTSAAAADDPSTTPAATGAPAASTPAASTPAASSGRNCSPQQPFCTGNGPDDADDGSDSDIDPNSYANRKRWSVGASVETNRTILQQDVGVRIKAFNTLSLYAAFAITKADRVSVSGGFIQRFIADETETGMRADDIGLSYSHSFRLPAKIGLTPSVGNSIPISFQSKLMGLIALPRASLTLSRSFFDGNLNLGVRGGGAYYIVEYKEAVGREDANTRASTNVGAFASYSMPFHPALQVAASTSTSWSWSYDVDHANDPVLAEQFKNTPVTPSADQFVSSPLAQQGYNYEVDVIYNLPSIVGMQSTFQVALNQGDGTLRDGATHLYWLSRRGGSVSASLTVSY